MMQPEKSGVVCYHASPLPGLAQLQPHVSNHGVPLLYFSQKRENVLVYLCNAVERYCREKGFAYSGVWKKWASYGFDRDGIQRLEEYYPNALAETYRGVAGYIYRARLTADRGFETRIPYAVTADKEVEVESCEYIPDAYEAILEAQRQGLLRIVRYEEAVRSAAFREWNARTIRQEYREAADHPEYRFFLEGKFGELLK